MSIKIKNVHGNKYFGLLRIPHIISFEGQYLLWNSKNCHKQHKKYINIEYDINQVTELGPEVNSEIYL